MHPRPLNSAPGLVIHVNSLLFHLPAVGGWVVVQERYAWPPGVCLRLEWTEGSGPEADRHEVRSVLGLFIPLAPGIGGQLVAPPPHTPGGWSVVGRGQRVVRAGGQPLPPRVAARVPSYREASGLADPSSAVRRR